MFKIGDMVQIINNHKTDCEVEDVKFGVIVDIADIEELANIPYSVFMYDSKNDYIGARYFGEDDLDRLKFSFNWLLTKHQDEEDNYKFHVGDKVIMVDGMDCKHFNDDALACEYGIVREIDTEDIKLPYFVEFYEPYYSFWCEEQQLRLVDD